MKVDILLCGVGGQGIIRASEILSYMFVSAGYDVKKNEIHGMSQRGGSVLSEIRANKEGVHSPIIPNGEADFLLSLEKIETVRYIDKIDPDKTKIIFSDIEIMPSVVVSGISEYPQNVENKILSSLKNAYYIKAGDIAKSIGNMNTINTIMLGFLSRFMDFDEDSWFEAIEKVFVKDDIVNINKKAFLEGKSYDI